LGRPINGSRMTMMRCSTGDRGEIGFVGIPQTLSGFSSALPFSCVPSAATQRQAPCAGWDGRSVPGTPDSPESVIKKTPFDKKVRSSREENIPSTSVNGRHIGPDDGVTVRRAGLLSHGGVRRAGTGVRQQQPAQGGALMPRAGPAHGLASMPRSDARQ
jgi:hypothetical protein